MERYGEHISELLGEAVEDGDGETVEVVTCFYFNADGLLSKFVFSGDFQIRLGSKHHVLPVFTVLQHCAEDGDRACDDVALAGFAVFKGGQPCLCVQRKGNILVADCEHIKQPPSLRCLLPLLYLHKQLDEIDTGIYL